MIVQPHQQVQSQLLPFSSPSIPLYKIFGHSRFTFECAQSPSVTDWSGFYTQLGPEHSMRYLTKKWGDGANFACLGRLRCQGEGLRVLRVSHGWIGMGGIGGEVKAKLIKKHVQQKYGIDFSQRPLLLQLGHNKIVLQCMDSEDEQIIIPHNILTQEYFIYEGLIIFQKSNDGMLRTIRWRKYGDEEGKGEWKVIKGQEQFQPYLLVRGCEEIRQICGL